MDPKLVQAISNKVYARFPEMRGKKPKIKQAKTVSANLENFVLTYNTVAQDIRGNSIPRHVRVVVDAKGKIIKMSTSR
jgi:CO dehydrogenase/acetyl-CoA synthase gamma subunit (corrinoid Fe-S protein)